jgi:hypothetical protein
VKNTEHHREKLIELRIGDRVHFTVDGVLGTVIKKARGVAWIRWDDGQYTDHFDFIRGAVNRKLELVWPPGVPLRKRT